MQRDVRATELYRQVEDHFLKTHRPAFGQVSSASDPNIRPDGKAIAFTGKIFSELVGDGVSRVCVAEAGSIRVLTEGPGNQKCPQFSPDGRWLAYMSDAERLGDFQVRVLDVTSGVERVPHGVAGSVEYLSWSPDGANLLLGVAGYGADLAGCQGSGTTNSIDGDADPWLPEIFGSPSASDWRSAWVVDVTTGIGRQVSQSRTNIWECAWAGTDAILAVTSQQPGEGAWYTADLRQIDLKSGEETVEFASQRQLGWPSAPPSGERLAVVVSVCSDRKVVAGDVYVGTGHQSFMAIDTLGVDTTYTAWLDEARIGFAGVRGLMTVVGIHDLASGRSEEVWSGHENIGDRYPDATFLPDGSAAAVLSSYTRYPELALLSDGSAKTALSLHHPGADYLAGVSGRAEAVNWQAPDGMKIEGILCTPNRPGPHPLIMLVHGGPISCYRERWSMGQNYTPLLVSRGYAVLHPNPRGSSGHGQAFMGSVVGDMGGQDAVDLLSGIDALVARGVIDSKRVGVMGGSYGGFMTAWLITQDQRFSAAVPMSPVTDWRLTHHTSNIPEFDRMFLGGDPLENSGAYIDRSPLQLAKRVRTPTFLTAGAQDRCTPPSQAVAFHVALNEAGVDSAVAIYPQEGHGVRSFPAIVDVCTRIVEWFEQYMPA